MIHSLKVNVNENSPEIPKQTQPKHFKCNQRIQ